MSFDFTASNRRPPTDPVNALLSCACSLLVRTWTGNLTAVGLDAYRGCYHQPRYGRPASALDIMEPFRPIIADLAVLQAINDGEVRPSDFIAAFEPGNYSSLLIALAGGIIHHSEDLILIMNIGPAEKHQAVGGEFGQGF